MGKYSKSLGFVLIFVIAIMSLTLVACDFEIPQETNKQYNIIISIDGNESTIMYDGQTLTLPTNPVKEGCVFLGWELEDGTPFNIEEYIKNPTDIRLVAKFKENHVHHLYFIQGTEPTCTENGSKGYYKCDCGAVFEDKYGEIAIDDLETWKVIPKLGHDYFISYKWNEDNTQCSALRVCKRDSSHREEVTVNTTKIVTAPTCTTDGNTEYTADFSKTEWAENQVKNVSIEKLGHNYSVSYKWSDDKTQCTAIRVCQNDNSHKEEVTVNTTFVRIEPTCTTDGNIKYTAEFPTTVWAHYQTENVTLTKLGHNYGEFINEVLPTCETDGVLGHYHCDRCNKDFDINKKELTSLVISKLGHNYSISYTWNDDKSKCTATRVCQNDNSHKDEVTVDTTSVRTEPTCEVDGNIAYTADFSGTDWAENQVKNVSIEKLGHNYSISYVWSENNTKCTALRVCQNDNSHREEVSVNVTIEEVAPTCTTDGHRTYMAVFSSAEWAEPQMKKEVISQLGHHYIVNYDKDNHWEECTNCGDKRNVTPHTFDSVTHKCTCGAYENNPCTEGLVFKPCSDTSIDAYMVDRYIGTDPIVAIPETYNGKPVVEINDYAFYYRFVDHTDIQITEVYIPDSVTIIGFDAFKDTKLTTVKLPKNLINLKGSFEGCKGLTEIFIPRSVKFIDDNSFKDCTNLARIDFEQGSQLKDIGSRAFEACINLTNIEIPETVDDIYFNAFAGCTSLESITLPKGVTIISADLFNNCVSLKSVEILGQITKISEQAFMGCKVLENLVLPASTETILKDAFKGCNSLVIYCPLSERPVYQENPSPITGWHYTTKDIPTVWNYAGEYGKDVNGFRWALVNGDEVTICRYEGTQESVIVPNYIYGKPVTIMASLAFNNCRWVTDITLPDNLNEIEPRAFTNCISLLSVAIPRGVMRVGEHIFNCSPVGSVLRIYCENGYKPYTWDRYWPGLNDDEYIDEWNCHTIDTVNTYKFDAQNGSEIKVITSETIINCNNIETPTKKGFVFMGWCETPNCTGTPIAPHYYNDGETTLYAKWITTEEYNTWCDGSTFDKARNIDTAKKEPVMIPEHGKNVIFIFVPTESRTYTFHTIRNNSISNYGYLYDSHKMQISSFWCEEHSDNFSGEYDLIAGEIYYISIGMEMQNYSGDFDFEII